MALVTENYHPQSWSNTAISLHWQDHVFEMQLQNTSESDSRSANTQPLHCESLQKLGHSKACMLCLAVLTFQHCKTWISIALNGQPGDMSMQTTSPWWP
jgi:hypothetical protein